MVVELQVITDVLSQPDKDGKRKVLIKDRAINKLFNINDIEVEEFINPKNGKPVKKYSGIYNNDIYYKINKPYEELKDLKINRAFPIKGFMGYSSNYKHR
jgi:hypothetical protein